MKKFLITLLIIFAGMITVSLYAQENSNVVIDQTSNSVVSEINEAIETTEPVVSNDVVEDQSGELNVVTSPLNEDLSLENSVEAEDTDLEVEDDVVNTPQALAIIEGTSEDSELYGEVELTQTSEGVLLNAEIYNAPPGKHGFHVHENGDCSDKANAAGGHFNPDSTDHGLISKDGMEHAHSGDMGNVEINEEGEGTLSIVLTGASLTEGKYNIANKAIILHEKEDDFGQPTGNAGSRIGCGVIELITEE